MSIRRQSTLFLAVALPVMLLSQAGGLAVDRGVLLGMLGGIVLLGVPHGALDTLYARRQFKLRSWFAWLLFGLLYLVPAAAMVLLWRLSPAGFLLTFFLLSALHFSADLVGPVPLGTRLLYGGAILVLPSLRHSAEVEALLATLVSAEVAAWFSASLATFAMPWAWASAAAVVWLFQSSRRGAVEFAAVASLAVFALPLVSFTLYFCGMHSARHVLRSMAYHKTTDGWAFWAAVGAPMAIVLAALAAALTWQPNRLIEDELVQLIFVGLAAFTVPHMALVERVRLRGWQA